MLSLRFAIKSPVYGQRFMRRLSSIAAVAIHPPDHEGVLLSKTDPIGIVSPYYHPAVIREFRSYQPEHSKNHAMKALRLSAEKYLVKLNKEADLAYFLKSKYSSRPASIESIRFKSAPHLFTALKTIKSEEELKAFAAFLVILMPTSKAAWYKLDKILSRKLSKSSRETAFLFAYACMNAQKELRLERSNIITPKMLLKKLQADCISEGNVLGSVVFDEDMTNFGEIGGLQVVDSKAVEQFSLQLALFANNQHEVKSLSKKILEDMTDHGVKVLSSLHSPVKFQTLRRVWENISKVDLPNSYLLYKSLYEQIGYSISANSLQTLHQEEPIGELFNCMVQSNHKSNKLIHDVWSRMSDRGISYEALGVRQFNNLIELGCIPYALDLLEDTMRNSIQKVEKMFAQNRIHKASSLSLSDLAKDGVYHMLKSKRMYAESEECQSSLSLLKASELVLALWSYNNEKHDSPYYKLTEWLEYETAKILDNLTVNDLVGLLHTYGSIGRYHPEIVNKINTRLSENLSAMNTSQLSTILWANARLNFNDIIKDGESFNRLIAIRIIGYITSELSSLSYVGAYTLSRTLWALAVLNQLELEDYKKASRLIRKYLNAKDIQSVNWLVVNQLSQAMVELRSKYLLQPTVVDSEIEKLFTEDDILNGTHAGLSIESENNDVSSWTHRDLSQVLNHLGIDHENEKKLSNGAVVDIFIANTLGKASSKGTVLEFDGPYHFETYLNVSSSHSL